MKDKPNIEAVVTSAEAFHQMSFNIVDDPNSTAHPAVLDPVVREAVSWAIDKPTLVDRVLRGYGEPGTTPIVPLYDQWHWEPPAEEAIGFDPAEATRLLEEAGYVDTDSDGIREMPGRARPARVAAVHRHHRSRRDQGGALRRRRGSETSGSTSSTKSMTDSKLYDQWYGFDWDMIIYSWGMGPDPDFILSSFTSEQCGYWSDTCYANPEYDDLYEEQQVALDRTERQGIVYRDAADDLRGHARDRAVVPQLLRGVAVRPLGGLRSLARARRRGVLGQPLLVRRARAGDQRARRWRTDSGMPAAVWVGGLVAVAAVVGVTILARRRRSEHYAALTTTSRR